MPRPSTSAPYIDTLQILADLGGGISPCGKEVEPLPSLTLKICRLASFLLFPLVVTHVKWARNLSGELSIPEHVEGTEAVATE